MRDSSELQAGGESLVVVHCAWFGRRPHVYIISTAGQQDGLRLQVQDVRGAHPKTCFALSVGAAVLQKESHSWAERGRRQVTLHSRKRYRFHARSGCQQVELRSVGACWLRLL